MILSMAHEKNHDHHELRILRRRIDDWARELGFAACGVAGTDLAEDEQRLLHWLDRGYHGDMAYMARHGTARSRPAELLPGTVRVLCLRMNYLPLPQQTLIERLDVNDLPAIACYALGKDYHKLIRKRLQLLVKRINDNTPGGQFRVFTDSAPVLEKPLAAHAALGWIGKHTNLINTNEGSWFFLGEIYTDLPLPTDNPTAEHCGTCTRCIDVCPTQAIVDPFVLDARRCISYLTIEFRGSIPIELRPLIGNRIFGCDDCQLFCPWNRFAPPTTELGFHPRPVLLETSMIDMFLWSEDEFLQHTEGNPIRRIGHECWLRNLAVALGNSRNPAAIDALRGRLEHPSELVREHVEWALTVLERDGG